MRADSVTQGSRARQVAFLLATVAFFVAAGLVSLGLDMHKGLDHDENMYVAAAALLGRNAYVPYLDCPFFQMPYMAIAYAPVLAWSTHMLLAARVLSLLCGLVTLVLVFFVGARQMRGAPGLAVWLAGAAAASCLLANPVVNYASGLAWNHDLPVMLAVLAFAVYMAGARSSRAGWHLFASGLLAAAATGSRLSFAVVLIPLAAGIVVFPTTAGGRGRLRLLAALILGTVIGLLPALALFLVAPERFLFGNAGYHALNETYWLRAGYDRTMTLSGKLGYLWEVAREPATLALLATAGAVWLLVLVGLRRRRPAALFSFALSIALALALVAGALAPTPSWYQYYYAPVPFLALAVVCGLGCLREQFRAGAWSPLLLLPAAGVALALWLPGLPAPASLWPPDKWIPEQVHAEGVRVASETGRGRVLTLSPLYPLEGGAEIYPAFSAGPFGWRVAPLLAQQDRARLGLVSPADLDRYLRDDPPAAVLTGYEGGLDEPLAAYSREHGYRPVDLGGGATLWLGTR